MLTQVPPIYFLLPLLEFHSNTFPLLCENHLPIGTLSTSHTSLEIRTMPSSSFFLFNYLNFFLFCILTSLYSLLSPPLSPSTQLLNLSSSISIQKETDLLWAYIKHGTELLPLYCAQPFTKKILLVVGGN